MYPYPGSVALTCKPVIGLFIENTAAAGPGGVIIPARSKLYFPADIFL